MFLRELSASPSELRGVGPSMLETLSAAGLTTVSSLLTHYPRDWEDRSRSLPLRDWNKGPVCTTVSVLAHDWFGYGAMKTLKIHVEDESARAVLVCFNRPFLQRQLPVGASFRLWGRFFYKYGGLQSTAFEIGRPGEHEGILPVYPLTKDLTQTKLRRLIKQALETCGAVDDEIPPNLIQSESLFSKAEALRTLHFPPGMEALEKARRTLIYEELFYLELMIGRRLLERKGLKGGSTPAAPPAFSPLQQQLIERLPFSLTPGQEAAINEINADMAHYSLAAGSEINAHSLTSGSGTNAFVPMARLLQGDVGSGKTLVAFLSALRAADEGGQAAIMAPTELLARQHADNAAKLLEPLGIKPAYLTGNLKSGGRARLLAALAAGEIDIVLGTHALFSKDVVYRNLALVIIDEQHRFGVTQRQAILAKGLNSLQKQRTPDLLMMSATPIPRTLALTVFGDLDVSVIADMPPGRKPVKTHLAKESNAAKVYDFVRKELEAGRQAYFVYPLIGEDSDADNEGNGGGLRDAVSMAEKLSKEIFPAYRVALVHSKIDDEEKRKTMEAFRTGEIRVLAATSVVEVGVDVPNASCMVINHAERFGLSALHQLRGRVGRGQDQAYCFLIYSEPEQGETNGELSSSGPNSALTDDGKQRLKVMLESNDGFVIAEEDLKLRGPGQIAGIEQSGYLKLGIADPVRDADILVRARTGAFAMLEADPGLLLPEHRRVAEVLERAPPFKEVGL
ncbi:ATP-dependent DNA helicase RecG [Spirochaetia bacterium]|nr:ATP-dependent DNA helicase RecG [Spirochaetia bacterium]